MESTNVISIGREMASPVHERRLHLVDAISWIFGCKHTRLSRPHTRDRETFQTCLGCGMHREFDLENWRPRGSFYAERVDPNRLTDC
jgi:hypothetical protein